MNAGEFVDLTATPQPSASDVIYCSGVTSGTLTGCITNDSSGISVGAGDLVEQVLGVVNSNAAATAPATGCSSGSTTPTTSGTGAMPCDVPVGPNTTNGDGGLAGFTLFAGPTSTANVGGSFVAPAAFTPADDLTMNALNNNAPLRLYVDGQTVYCTNSNFAPSSKIEDCTTPNGCRSR